jgi:hypothetical protein
MSGVPNGLRVVISGELAVRLADTLGVASLGCTCVRAAGALETEVLEAITEAKRRSAVGGCQSEVIVSLQAQLCIMAHAKDFWMHLVRDLGDRVMAEGLMQHAENAACVEVMAELAAFSTESLSTQSPRAACSMRALGDK